MTEIICRLDPFKAQPVVFMVDSYNSESKEIKAWTDGKGAEAASLEYYRNTLPLSEADEAMIAKRFSDAMGAPEIHLRHRLPRLKRPLPNIFASGSTGVPVVAGEVDFKAAMDALQAEMADKLEALHRAWRNKKK